MALITQIFFWLWKSTKRPSKSNVGFSKSNFGKRAKKIPNKNIIADLLNILIYKFEDFFLFERESEIETPTINRKKGKTKSVGVAPFHSACLSGA